MNSTCGAFPVTTVSPLICSGNGYCAFNPVVNASICHCNAGWVGDSDFKVTSSQTDCHIYLPALQTLWSIYLIFHVAVGLLLFVPKLLTLRASQKAKYGATPLRTFWFSKRSGVFTIAWYLLLGYPCQFSYAVIKLAKPEWSLGESIALTVIYSAWRITFYVSSTMFYTSLLTSILKSQRRFASVLQRAYAMSTVYTSAMLLLTVVPFIPMFAEENAEVGMASVAVFLNVCSLAMMYFASISQYVRRHILQSDMFVALSRTAGTDQSDQQRAQKQLLLKFANLMRSSRNVALSQAVLYGVFGCIPYLWNKHDYLLPFTWVPVVLVALNILTSLQTDEDERTRQQRVEQEELQRQRLKENVMSTAAMTVDCESVVNVDVDSPELLATSARWKSLQRPKKQVAAVTTNVEVIGALQ